MNLDHTIAKEDVIVPEYCPYLNVKITNNFKQGAQMHNASIDRINPHNGYVPGNIQVISLKANLMKNAATIDQLITFAKNIIILYGEK